MPDQPPAPRLRALIYNRVSADPSGRRISTASQDAENRAFCERQNWDIAGTITDDDRSASRFATRQREGYQQVLRAIDGTGYGRIDVVVTWESSRGERKLDGYVALRSRLELNNCLLAYKGRIFDMSDGDDRFATGLDALLDEREAERARERTLRSHRDSAQRGTPRGVVPYGYLREYDQASGRMLRQVVDPATAPVVQDIVERILTGDTLYAIAADLNRRGILTPRGQRDARAKRESQRAGWSTTIIRHLLGKQSLTGVRTHNGVVTGEAKWPPIVTAADWAQVQQILRAPGRVAAPRGVAARHLLSGIATCGVCGAWLRPFNSKGRMTYRCAGLLHTGSKGHVSRDAAALDSRALTAAGSRLEDPQILAARSPGDAEAAGAGRELAGLRARLAQLETDVANGAMSGDAFGRIEQMLQAQIAALLPRTVPRTVPPFVLALAGPQGTRALNSSLLVEQRRIVRVVLRVVVHRTSTPGSAVFDESTVEFTPLL